MRDTSSITIPATQEIERGANDRDEGFTTFFRNEADRQVVDCWSTRLASFRTSDVLIIRRRETTEPVTIGGPHLEAAS